MNLNICWWKRARCLSNLPWKKPKNRRWNPIAAQNPAQTLEIKQDRSFKRNIYMYNFTAVFYRLKASYCSLSGSKTSHWPLINLKNVNADLCYGDNSNLGLLLHEAFWIWLCKESCSHSHGDTCKERQKPNIDLRCHPTPGLHNDNRGRTLVS